jgi:proteasome assembly chaperone (PAC2) family protein
MSISEYLHVKKMPELREPVLITGFAGWNDASQVATYAITTLVNTWSASRFAEIEPETFFDFTVTRPTISLDPSEQRHLHWPANYFFAHELEGSERDVVLFLGTEPQLRWRTFCGVVLQLAEALKVSCLVTLGGLLADVPHTVEPRLTGFSNTPRLLPQLQKLGVGMSHYEGPTGILGVLHDAWRGTDRPAVSLWGNVPHYISATPNPHISLALLQRVSTLIGVELPLRDLETQSRAFREQIDEALRENPEAMEYVQQLERQLADEEPAEDAPELIDELEEFLRSRRPPDEGGEGKRETGKPGGS